MNIGSLDIVYDYFHFALLMLQEWGCAMYIWDIHRIEDRSGYPSSLFDLVVHRGTPGMYWSVLDNEK